MLVIRCAACRRKLWKYNKIGSGAVLRCYKSRITQIYTQLETQGDKLACPCGTLIGIDKGPHIKMIAKGFTYKGRKKRT